MRTDTQTDTTKLIVLFETLQMRLKTDTGALQSSATFPTYNAVPAEACGNTVVVQRTISDVFVILPNRNYVASANNVVKETTN